MTLVLQCIEAWYFGDEFHNSKGLGHRRLLSSAQNGRIEINR